MQATPMGAKTASHPRGIRGPAKTAITAMTRTTMPGTSEFSGPPGRAVSRAAMAMAPTKMAAAL